MRLIRSSPGAALACLALAACVPAPPKPTPAPAPAPAPAPTPRPPAPPTPVPIVGHWMDAPLTPGDWSYRGGQASFGEIGRAPRLSLRCDAGGQLTISYFGAAAQPATMTIRTETMERAVGEVSVAGAQGTAPVVGRVPARDPLLDAMAFSKGRFVVEVSGAQTLYVPAYPEVTRVIEDCR